MQPFSHSLLCVHNEVHISVMPPSTVATDGINLVRSTIFDD